MSTTPKMTVVEGGRADDQVAPPDAEAADELTLSVTVITPFGGGSEDATRRHVFNYHRVRHIVEDAIKVVREDAAGELSQIRYKVGICLARSGNISLRALTKLARSNIVVALLSEHNVNVIYELGIRNLHRPETIILVNRIMAQEGREPIPVYLKESAYNLFSDPCDGICEAIDAHQPTLDWQTKALAPEVTAAMDETDRDLRDTLQQSFQELVDNPPRWLESMNEMARNRHPEGFLQGWSTYLPTSIVRINWKRRSDDLSYRPEDMDGAPVVADANYLFRRIFHIENLNLGPDYTSDITFDRLMHRIQPFITPQDYEDFLSEQVQLMNWIVLGNGHATAYVPLRFKEDSQEAEAKLHPNQDIRGKVYLPCLTAKSTVGDPEHPHSTYLLISFVEQFWPTDHPMHPNNRDR